LKKITVVVVVDVDVVVVVADTPNFFISFLQSHKLKCPLDEGDVSNHFCQIRLKKECEKEHQTSSQKNLFHCDQEKFY